MEDCNEGSGDLYLLPVGSEAAAAALASWRFQPGEGGPFAVGAEEAQHIYEEVELPELPASSSSLSLGGSLRTKRAGGVAGTMGKIMAFSPGSIYFRIY